MHLYFEQLVPIMAGFHSKASDTERTRVCQQYDHSLMLYLLFLLLGNSHQGDWWSALDTESSMQGSTTITPDNTERTSVCQQYDHSLML